MKKLAFAVAAALGLGPMALAQEQAPAEPEARESSGARVDTGKHPQMGEVQQLERLQREQYERIAEEVGVEPWPSAVATGQGGSGQAGTGAVFEACAKALGKVEPVTLVTGEVRHVSKDLLTVEGPYGRTVSLRTGPETCALTAGQPMQLSALPEGTAVRASYDIVDGKMTARVVRVVENQERSPEKQ